MYIDIFLLVVLVWSVYMGWRQGFLKEVISAVGFLVGLLVAATCYSTLGRYLTDNDSDVSTTTNIVAFFILWIIVPIVLGFVANMLTAALKGMKLGLPNSLLGALVSVLKYVILLSCVFYMMEALGIMDTRKAATSRLYAPAKGVVSFALKHVMPEQAAASANRAATDSLDEAPADTVWVDTSGPRTKKAAHTAPAKP